MEHTENTILIRGQLQQLPQLSHENHGKRFYRFCLEVPRLSGTVDILPVIAQEHLLNQIDLSGGAMIQVRGQIRSHNLKTDGTRRLLIFVFAGEIITTDELPTNQVVLQGPLCREPNLRRTPLGRDICDVMLAAPRAFKRADYLPCILWGRTAQEISACHTGDVIRIEGRFQSRVYNKVTDRGTEERMTYEISALSAEMVEEIL
jgi:primosomal replication protein N